MIGMMFKPFFKKFFGIFVCMTVVSMLSIALLIAFGSTIYNVKKTFETYLSDYGDTDAVIEIPYTEKAALAGLGEVEGVEGVEYRLTMDAFLQKANGRTLTARIFTFKDDGSSLFDRYVLEHIPASADMINVSVVRKFALNNDFKVGDTFKVGYFGEYLDFFINEIIETPEAIQARANNYVWSDNTDFGYIYVCESQLNKAIDQLAALVSNKIETDEAFAQKYYDTVDAIGDAFPDIIRQVAVNGFSNQYTNQLLVKGASDLSQEETVRIVKGYLEEQGITVKGATENHNMFYYVYVEHAIEQVQVASIFLPVFFYVVTMIVIGLFVNQIIKTMTPQMGIMMSVGVEKKSMVSIFSVFSLAMAIAAGVFGSLIGFFLNRMLTATMIKVYSIPTIPFAVNAVIVALSVLFLAIMAQITTLISCRAIFRITPKDAMISNEAARKPLSPRLERIIERSPMSLKLSLNSIAQNPRRFFVSVFSIFAASVIILLSLFFHASKAELMAQSVERRLSFDAQVYMTSVADEAFVEEVRAQESVKDLLDCYYNYLEASSLDGEKHTYLECLAFDEREDTSLVAIPDGRAKGTVSIRKEGIVLPKTTAKLLGVKKGDRIEVNGVSVEVSDVSYQYFHPIAYLSKTQMEAFGASYISSFLVDLEEEESFLDYMSKNNSAFTVFTSNLSKDLQLSFNSMDPMIYILILFSLLMGFVILTIMSQNTLMEQKRQISVLRAVGFTIFDISNLWTIQSISQWLLSSFFAIPVASLAAVILFKIVSSASQIYPFIFSASAVLFTMAFVFGIILISHGISMWTIKRWNLADNTRSRE